MIHKANIEIVVDTEKEKSEEWVKLSIKAEPKIARTLKISLWRIILPFLSRQKSWSFWKMNSKDSSSRSYCNIGEIPELGRCPVCGGHLLRLWGEMWDWDRAVCSNRHCDYDIELDEMTCTEPDGSIIQFIKPMEDE